MTDPDHESPPREERPSRPPPPPEPTTPNPVEVIEKGGKEDGDKEKRG